MNNITEMSNVKQAEFFDATNKPRVHIIGCGSVGSTLADLIARAGFKKIDLWDSDEIEPKNVVNSMLSSTDVGRLKTDVVKQMIEAINPAAEVRTHGWYKGELLNGIVLLAVDKIDVRRDFVNKNIYNPNVKCVGDFRTMLKSAQHFFARWDNKEEIKGLKESMNFDSSECETEVSACGITLGVAPTVRIICAYGVANLINYLKTSDCKRLIVADAFNFEVDAM